VSVFYVTKVELYAGITQDLSSLPSFGPEEVPTGNDFGNEREMVNEERQVNMIQEAEEEEQEPFPMNKPDGETHVAMVPLAEVRHREVPESQLETE